MSHIINKLLGREDESESHSHTQTSHGKTETHTSTETGGSEKRVQRKNSGGGQVTEGRTVQHEGVNIKSTISSDATSTVSMANQQKLNDLVTRLGSTHNQIDEYAKKQTAKINTEIQSEIDQVLVRTRQEQETLLRQANEHTAQIDSEYRAKLQKMVEQVDADKAKSIADVEQLLNKQQADILQAARNEIDQLNQKAANLKIGVLRQAQAKAACDANEITARATELGQSSTLHQSTGTTTIKTEVSAATTTKDASQSTATATNRESHANASATKISGETKTVETSREQSHNTRK